MNLDLWVHTLGVRRARGGRFRSHRQGGHRWWGLALNRLATLSAGLNAHVHVRSRCMRVHVQVACRPRGRGCRLRRGARTPLMQSPVGVVPAGGLEVERRACVQPQRSALRLRSPGANATASPRCAVDAWTWTQPASAVLPVGVMRLHIAARVLFLPLVSSSTLVGLGALARHENVSAGALAAIASPP